MLVGDTQLLPQADPGQGTGGSSGEMAPGGPLAPPLLVLPAPHAGTNSLCFPRSFGGSGFLSQISEAWPDSGPAPPASKLRVRGPSTGTKP